MIAFAGKAFRLWMAELAVDANPTIEGYAEALTWAPGSDEYHAIRGGAYRSSLDRQDLEAAVAEFEKAVELNPRIWLHHLDLAVTHELLGDSEATEKSFAEALRLNPHNTGLRWQVANFYLRRADLPVAMREFRAAVELDPSRLKLAANRLGAMGVSIEEIAEKLVPPQRPQLLDFLYFVLSQTDFEPERAAHLAWGSWERWQQAPAEESFRIRNLFRFIDYLLRQNELERAREVWGVGLWVAGEVEKQEVARQESEVGGREVVFNGGFESGALNGGLDWVLPNHAEVYYEEDYRTRFQGLVSLRIDFSGASNLHYRGLRQNLILPGGELQLEFVARSEDITSRIRGSTWRLDRILGISCWRDLMPLRETSPGENFLPPSRPIVLWLPILCFAGTPARNSTIFWGAAYGWMRFGSKQLGKNSRCEIVSFLSTLVWWGFLGCCLCYTADLGLVGGSNF